VVTSAALDRNVRSQRGGRSVRSRCAAAACALGLLAAGACGGGGGGGGGVTISYDQAANFTSYKINPGDQEVTTPGAMFILYRITRINNTAAIPFTFDKHKVLAGPSGKTRNEETAADTQLLGDRLIDNLQVPSKKDLKDPGCIIKLVDATGASGQASALIPATYQKDAQNVKMERATDDNVTTPFTVATSITLRNFCRA
jgi:hypothetical protein